MRLQVRNTDDRELPNLAVTVETDPGASGDAPTAFGQASDRHPAGRRQQPGLDRRPRPRGRRERLHEHLGARADVPGRDQGRRVAADRGAARHYTIKYRIAPGLNGKAVAGQRPEDHRLVRRHDLRRARSRARERQGRGRARALRRVIRPARADDDVGARRAWTRRRGRGGDPGRTARRTGRSSVRASSLGDMLVAEEGGEIVGYVALGRRRGWSPTATWHGHPRPGAWPRITRAAASAAR